MSSGTLPVAAQSPTPAPIALRVLTLDFEIDNQSVRVPGYSLDDRPGAPLLPVWSTVVELPAGVDWEVSYQSPASRQLQAPALLQSVPVPDVTPPGPHGWAADAGLPSAVPTVVTRPAPAIYQVDAFYPASPVVPGAEQWHEGRRLLALRVYPFQYNPVADTLRYHPEIEITIRLSPAGAQPNPTGPSGVGSPGDSVGPVDSTAANAAASTSGALRIRTDARGLYRLTYDDLLAAGVPLATTDPATFAMSYLGQPVSIEVMDDGDPQFEQGEAVIFYAEPYQGRYQTSNVYWLTYGGAGGPRITTRSVMPTGNEPVITSITQTLHVELDGEYRSDYPRPQDADHWFDLSLNVDSTTTTVAAARSYDLALDDALTSGNVVVRTAVHGGVDRPANPDKSMAVRLNNHPVGTYQWEGRTYYQSTASAPAAWLDAATNQVTLEIAIAQLPGIDFYSVSPDWVELTYPALAEAEGDRIYVEGVAPGANKVSVAGFSQPDVRVYDVRNPRQPVRLLTTEARQAGASTTFSFWDADLPHPTYMLSTEPSLLTPLAIEPDTPSTWRSPSNAYDYIAIVHPSLSGAVQPLLNHRTAEGFRVAKVDVQDVYDEWSFGRRDPEAIRSFLSYAYHNWNGNGATAPGRVPTGPVSAGRGFAGPVSVGRVAERIETSRTETPPAFINPPPQYVLLVGDGHYDFKGVSGTSLPNLIPPYLIDVDPWLGEIAADNRFVSVDGASDYLPDMAIGRIPANNADDVTAVVNKIIAYETTAPAGDWQKQVVFVAESNFDPAGNFHAYSDEIRLNWLPASYQSQTIYYNRDYFTSEEMRSAIRSAFDADALYLQWFGHSGRFRWGTSLIFNIFDPAVLLANDTWPFTAAYSCWAGYFINLAGNYQSLGETLLLTPQRGSVADLSPSGLHIGDSLLVLNQGLVKSVFQDRIDRVGLAVNAAKLHYFGHSGSFPDVIDTSVFFGDPALKLRLPPIDLGSSSMAVSPAQAAPGDALHYTVMVQNTGTFTANNVTVAVDYADAYGQVSASLPPAADAGGVLTWTLPNVPPGATTLSFDLALAPVLPAGVTTLHAPTAVRSWGNLLANLDAVSQVSAAPDLGTSSLAAARDWAPPGMPLTYTLTLRNTGNAPSAATWLTVTLPADLVAVRSSDMTYDEQAHQLTWDGAVPVTAPARALAFRATISPQRSACGQLDVAASLRDQLGQATSLAAAVQLAVPDVDCSGTVDIVDIQHVTARWGAAQGDPTYHPRYDLDGNDQIALLDVVIAAEAWQ